MQTKFTSTTYRRDLSNLIGSVAFSAAVALAGIASAAAALI